MQYPPHFVVVRIAVLIVGLTWGVFELADGLAKDRETDLDHRVVLALRQPDNLQRMIGPVAIEESMRDFTALGGYAVLITTVVGFSIFAWAEPRTFAFRFFVLSSVGGFFMGVLMKQLVQRARPSLVPHLSHVSGNTSFPSSHAMMSVVIYVTVGFLLAELTQNRHLRYLLVGLPVVLALLVGISRVCMGVHYPTDVLGGWTCGLVWTWSAFAIRSRLRSDKDLSQSL
jgi:undecaprenyl-diphosphatase